jgi:hypothetical protein
MSSERSDRLETIGVAVAFILVAAFIISAVLGVVHRPAPAAVATIPDKVVAPEPRAARGRIEVLNGAGKSGLARAATEQLRAAGFDVVFFGTTRARTDSSVVIDRVGRNDIATAAAAALEITSVRSQKDSTLLLDATVIVGADWTKRQVAKQQEIGWKAKVKRWLGR